MKRVAVDIYHTYGKSSGEELTDRVIIEDTREAREEIFDMFSYDDSLENEEDLISGKIDTFHFDRYGGDWDEPTGGFVMISTEEELINIANNRAQWEIERIKEIFK